jgi:penicillin-binding protein 2
VFVGLAALQSGKVTPEDEFSCPASMEIGNLTFRNWKKEYAGELNFVEALTQSCNPYFYQVGLKIGAVTISDTALRLGLGLRTGIPLASETNGRVPTEEYMQRVYKRKFMPGDTANLSIGQGDTLISPLQMAQAMAAIGNGGTLYQTRLVAQVQGLENQIITAYDVRARSDLGIDKKSMTAIRRACVNVVSGANGTAGRAGSMVCRSRARRARRNGARRTMNAPPRGSPASRPQKSRATPSPPCMRARPTTTTSMAARKPPR